MHAFASSAGLIGHTPLLAADRFARAAGLSARLLVKLECFNPTGSVKDRAALFMLDAAAARGLLRPGGTVIEPTSGNTGIALAALCAARGYRAVLVMPDSMSAERRALLMAYGAKLVLTDGAGGMAAAVDAAARLARETPGSFVPNQFENPANPLAHYETTGPELWADTDGALDAFVAGVGSGGSLTGTARYLRRRRPGLYVAAAEPAASPVLSGGRPAPHGIPGLGAGFVPTVFDAALCNEIIPVADGAAREMCRLFARCEGILTGPSSGAALCAAAALARRPAFCGKTIAALLPDGGERYLSTGLFA